MLAGIISMFLINCPTIVFAQSDEVSFLNSDNWTQVVENAKASNKYIFVDCYASWCGPCKLMDQKVYTSDKVGAFFNKRFVCVKLQMDTSKKDSQEIQHRYQFAHDVLTKYHVNAYPTFLFFDPSGKIVHRGLGYHDTTNVIKMGMDAMDPTKQYYTLKDRYEKGERLTPIDFMSLAWLAKRLEGDEVGHRIAKTYIEGLSHQALMDSVNLEFMYFFTLDTKDRGFTLFNDSAKAIAKVVPRFSVEVSQNLVSRVLYKSEIRPFEVSKNGKPDWERIRENLAKYGTAGQLCLNTYRPKLVFASVIEPAMETDPDWAKTFALVKRQKLGSAEKYLFGYIIPYYEAALKRDSTEHIQNLFACGKYYLDRFPDVAQAPQHNEFAYEIFQHDTVKADLWVALRWSKYSIDSAKVDDPWIPDYMDTYANLLYKLGDVRQAIDWEEKAAVARPKDKSIVDVLKKMKMGQPTW
jgi:thioredoxin-related protein